MFQHAMHDRAATQLNAADASGKIWLRAAKTSTDYTTIVNQITTEGDSSLMQLGVDVVVWGAQQNGRTSVMITAADAHSSSASKLTGYSANSSVQGSAEGIYGTWLANPTDLAGSYADAWLQYGNYRNKVQSEGLAREKYKSYALSGSVEVGHA